MKSPPKWIQPAMGWTLSWSNDGESDFKSFFDHTISFNSLIVSFPYGFDKTKIDGFRSFCKLYGYEVHFYEKPSSYNTATNTVVIHPRIRLDTPYITLERRRLVKILDERYPAPHEFVLGEEIHKMDE